MDMIALLLQSMRSAIAATTRSVSDRRKAILLISLSDLLQPCRAIPPTSSFKQFSGSPHERKYGRRDRFPEARQAICSGTRLLDICLRLALVCYGDFLCLFAAIP